MLVTCSVLALAPAVGLPLHCHAVPRDGDQARAPVRAQPIHNNDAGGPHCGENRGLVFDWTLGGLVLQYHSQSN